MRLQQRMGLNKLQYFAKGVPGKEGVVTPKKLESRCNPLSLVAAGEGKQKTIHGTRHLSEGPMLTGNL